MSINHAISSFLLILSFLFIRCGFAAVPEVISGLENLGSSQALSVSSDGSIVFGLINGKLPYFWTEFTGYRVISLPDVDLDAVEQIDIVSSEAAVIVLILRINGSDKSYRLDPWKGAMKIRDLGSGDCTVQCISSKGDYIAGCSGMNMFLYDSEDDFILDLGAVRYDYLDSTAHAFSENGRVIVGRFGEHGFTYTSQTGFIQLPTLDGFFYSRLNISKDGRTIIGAVSGETSVRAVKLHPDKTMEKWEIIELGVPKDFPKALPEFVSADGTVIVGAAFVPYDADYQGFIYTHELGMTLIGHYGLRSRPKGLSGDGRIIVGTYIDSEDRVRSFKCKSTEPERLFDLGSEEGCSTEVCGISENGKLIVGYLEDQDGFRRSFIYRNNPEEVISENPIEGLNENEVANFDFDQKSENTDP